MNFLNDKENSRKWQFEALNKEQPIYVQRKNKISVLMKKLQEEKIVYVRSPRGSGKTSLAYLILDDAIIEYYDLEQTIYINCCTKTRAQSYDQWIQSQTGWENKNFQSFADFLKHYKQEKPTLIILDDFQELFELDELPRDFKAFTNYSNAGQMSAKVYLLCLATHGEHTLGQNINCSTPVPFNIEQRLDLSFLLFDEDEYKEAMMSYTQRHNPKLGTLLSNMTPEFSLYAMTSGHPGFLMWSISHIEQKFEKINNLSLKTILNYIYSDDFVQDISGYKTFQNLNPPWCTEKVDPEYKITCDQAKEELKKLLHIRNQILKVVNSDFPAENEINSAMANFLIKQGILIFTKSTHSKITESHVTWSFNYMRIFWLKRLSLTQTTVKDITDINEFIKEFLKQIPMSRLKNSIIYQDVEKFSIKNEAFWQNEFYRIAVERFGIKNIFPELGTTTAGDGKIDFYINSTKKWLIEFFVGSNRRGEHYERFNAETGRYRNFKTNNFQLVNFVFQEPKSIIETYKGLTVVYFNPEDNYTKATLYLFVRHRKAIDNNSDWRQSGHYEISEIYFDTEIYYKHCIFIFLRV